LVVGDKELETKNVSVRLHGGGDLGSMSVAGLIERLQQQIVDKNRNQG